MKQGNTAAAGISSQQFRDKQGFEFFFYSSQQPDSIHLGGISSVADNVAHLKYGIALPEQVHQVNLGVREIRVCGIEV